MAETDLSRARHLFKRHYTAPIVVDMCLKGIRIALSAHVRHLDPVKTSFALLNTQPIDESGLAMIVDANAVSQDRSRAHLPWAREAPFQTVHSVSRFLCLSNNLGNLLFARRAIRMVVSDTV